MSPTKANAPGQRGVSQPTKSERTPTVGNVCLVDGAVKPEPNEAQFLMIRRERTGAAFSADASLGDPDNRNLLGYYFWHRIGRPFPVTVCLDGDMVAWTEPLPKRTGRRRCMAATVARLQGWDA